MKLFYAILLLLIGLNIPLSTQAQDVEMVYRAGNTFSFYRPDMGFYRDEAGNSYALVRGTQGEIQVLDTTINYSGTLAKILCKFDSNMELLWTTPINYDEGSPALPADMFVDPEGNLYLTGFTHEEDYTYKFNSEGTLIWEASFGAEQIRYTEEENIQLIRYSDLSGIVDNEFLNGDRTTVVTIDTAGNYLNHLQLSLLGDDIPRIVSGCHGDICYGVLSGSTFGSTMHEIFIIDHNENVLDRATLTTGQGVLPINIVYDPYYHYYYAYGIFIANEPLNATEPSTTETGLFIAQYDEDLNFTRSLRLANEGGDLNVVPYQGDLFISLSSPSVTHFGPTNPIDLSADQLLFAKLDYTLNLKWAVKTGDLGEHENAIRIMPAEDGIFFACRANEMSINNAAYYDAVEDITNMFIIKINDADTTANYIDGSVFIDYNQNGINDNEPPFKNLKITNSATAGAHYTTAAGQFVISAVVGENIVRPTLPQYWVHSTPDSVLLDVPAVNATISAGAFGIYPSAVKDVAISLAALNPARPGFTVRYQLKMKNQALDTLNGLVYLAQDTALTFKSASMMPDSIVGDTLFWYYENLVSNEVRVINIFDSLSANTDLLNTTIWNKALITPILNDTTPTNNCDSVSTIVTGVYDPNDINVQPKCIDEDFLVNNGLLEYQIRFQNTGNDTAFNVLIRDTLSDFLDINTIEIGASSHDVEARIEENVLILYFPDILLPDSTTNYLDSNGYLHFNIKVKENTTTDANIDNQVQIYFDYNPPIATNIISIGFNDPVSILEVQTCDSSYTSLSGNNTWTSSGTYEEVLTNMDGCEARTIYHLSFNQSVIAMQEITACNSAIINGTTYFSSQSITDVIVGGAANGCDSTIVTELEIETLDVSVSQMDATLSANILDATYQWLHCDNDFAAILGATARMFTPTESGNYAVAIGQGLCQDTSDCLPVIITGLSEAASLANWQLYPNPTTGQVHLAASEAMPLRQVTVFNTLGQIVWQGYGLGRSEISFEWAGALGIYLVEWQVESGQKWRLKVLKN